MPRLKKKPPMELALRPRGSPLPAQRGKKSITHAQHQNIKDASKKSAEDRTCPHCGRGAAMNRPKKEALPRCRYCGHVAALPELILETEAKSA